ncbi:unnamed protein product [Urochloa decumbens]|uniref:AAA+ ATPase domain-containing protein n=1 Tax=Urochloa decumbens TaxID=240449 RepID=A0ABC8YB35_9POAL
MAAALLRLRSCSKLLGHGDPARWLPKAGMATRWLKRYGRDLTKHAADAADPVVGRDAEIDRVVAILSRRSKNSAVLVGPAGVGKTAIAEGLAQRLAAGRVPGALAGARVVELDVPAMVAGTEYVGTFEARVTGVIREAEAAAKPVVLFVDEIHMLLGAGLTRGSKMDVSDMLKPALGRGRLRCLGATTSDEYQQHFASDKALDRRFQKVHVAEPGEDATAAILRRLRPLYEEHHGVSVTDEALAAAISLAARYIAGRHFPDKAIDLVDEAQQSRRFRLTPHRRTSRILDDGKLTDGKGRTVDFTNTIIIMTSNLGAHHLAAGGGGPADDASARERVLADVRGRFRPELINRLGEMVMFRPLSGETLRKVVRMQLAGIAARLAAKGVGLDLADAAFDVVLSRCSDQVPMYGARPIKRCLETMVITRISRMMVQEEVDDGCSISIGADGGELVFNVERLTQAPPPTKSSPASVQTKAVDDGCDKTEALPSPVKKEVKSTTSASKKKKASSPRRVSPEEASSPAT